MAEIITDSVFNFKSYKEYLLSRLGQAGFRTGERSRLAAYLNCQTAYISQVLSGATNLSLEQAERTNRFFAHDDDESEVFLLLVLRERAGTKDLENYFSAKIQKLIKKRTDLKHRLKETDSLTKEAEAKYYSQWYYQAIHILVSIPEFQTRESIAQHFNLSSQQVSEALAFLESERLLVFEKGHYQFGPHHVHLQNTSENLSKQHMNWRLQAIQSLQKMTEKEDLHYSVVCSLSREDVEKIKQKISDLIRANMDIIKDSPEQVLYCNTIDFFEI